jgi:hypothetical protein
MADNTDTPNDSMSMRDKIRKMANLSDHAYNRTADLALTDRIVGAVFGKMERALLGGSMAGRLISTAMRKQPTTGQDGEFKSKSGMGFTKASSDNIITVLNTNTKQTIKALDVVNRSLVEMFNRQSRENRTHGETFELIKNINEDQLLRLQEIRDLLDEKSYGTGEGSGEGGSKKKRPWQGIDPKDDTFYDSSKDTTHSPHSSLLNNVIEHAAEVAGFTTALGILKKIGGGLIKGGTGLVRGAGGLMGLGGAELGGAGMAVSAGSWLPPVAAGALAGAVLDHADPGGNFWGATKPFDRMMQKNLGWNFAGSSNEQILTPDEIKERNAIDATQARTVRSYGRGAAGIAPESNFTGAHISHGMSTYGRGAGMGFVPRAIGDAHDLKYLNEHGLPGTSQGKLVDENRRVKSETQQEVDRMAAYSSYEPNITKATGGVDTASGVTPNADSGGGNRGGGTSSEPAAATPGMTRDRQDAIPGGSSSRPAPVAIGADGVAKPGTYRPGSVATERDYSDTVLRTIASEARHKDPDSIRAVINNMINRRGAKGYGSNLEAVATQRGQYEGWFAHGGSNYNEKEKAAWTQYIKDAMAGKVPDITNGADSYRASSYLKGAGRGKTFDRLARSQGFDDIGGNVYAKTEGFRPGPNSPFSPKELAAAGATSEPAGKTLGGPVAMDSSLSKGSWLSQQKELANSDEAFRDLKKREDINQKVSWNVAHPRESMGRPHYASESKGRAHHASESMGRAHFVSTGAELNRRSTETQIQNSQRHNQAPVQQHITNNHNKETSNHGQALHNKKPLPAFDEMFLKMLASGHRSA